MRRFLLIVALAPFIAHGQKLQLALNLGAQTNTPHTLPLYGSARVIADNEHAMIGGGVDVSRFAQSVTFNLVVASQLKEVKVNTVHMYVNPNIFANYKLPLKKGYVYLGPSIGYYYTNPPVIKTEAGNPNVQTGHRAEHGYSWGAQAGTTVFLTSKIGINAEAAYRRAKVKGDAGKFTYTHFPISLGVRYVL
jgi:hypothetical protein